MKASCLAIVSGKRFELHVVLNYNGKLILGFTHVVLEMIVRYQASGETGRACYINCYRMYELRNTSFLLPAK